MNRTIAESKNLWIKASTRTALGPSYQKAVKNEKTGSKHFRNWKGFEIPVGFVRVDSAKENSLLKELTTKSNGDFASAAEFKSGEARFYIVPLGSDDEFRVFYQLYYRADAKSGLKEVARRPIRKTECAYELASDLPSSGSPNLARSNRPTR